MRDFDRSFGEHYPSDEEIIKIVAHPPKGSLDLQNTNYGHRMRIHEMRTNERNDPDNIRGLLFDHPPVPLSSQLFSQFTADRPRPKRMVIAVGPDGGWSDDELSFFQTNNFHFIHLGDRIFRTDMAVGDLTLLLLRYIVSCPPLISLIENRSSVC
jgi:hypothetical protein